MSGQNAVVASNFRFAVIGKSLNLKIPMNSYEKIYTSL
ncbi:hypothetical protein J5U23_01762 [Saccharolobus shibatae B12]|uniref:Uncharacterized protein n=1 Tax=Saccharolobus shibatae (strain ATCC 51178 / DSM 5389 / JCM 8931 / NBRC 15437 / B12) TaxID=523848 RepID=A0A8F5BP49_SACSH|nr:hypothetical protein J5U23_01762 [Saccharolobus shibatae B12]